VARPDTCRINNERRRPFVQAMEKQRTPCNRALLRDGSIVLAGRYPTAETMMFESIAQSAIVNNAHTVLQ
jgi:hypothetical protein